MSMLRISATAASVVLGLSVGVFAAENQNDLRPNLGQPITPSDLAPWDITVMPDGTGLPPGSGTAVQGAPIFAQKCAACHGENGKGGAATMVTAGPPRATLDGGKTIANFWPYATTIFDYVRRAMPANAPKSLSDQ
jgi:S-disulfanyl-L-cysteine oxidoreductase SoxD